MIELAYTPQWFYGKDILIDIVSILVLGLISFYGIRYYQFDKKRKNHLFFSLSFAMLALSFLFKILTNFTIYYNIIKTTNLGVATLTHTIQVTHSLFILGFLLYRLLMLLGLMTLYAVYSRPNTSSVFLLTFLLLVTTYFTSSSYYVFHTTCFLFLLMITIRYWKNFKHKIQGANKLLAWSFCVITLSHLFFIFISLKAWLYVLGEIVQLIGYTMLLVTFIKVLKDGKKKRKK